MRQTLTLACLLAALFHARAMRADTVLVATSGSTPGRLTGEIVEYTGAELRLRQAGGRESSIPADRVLSIETAFAPQQEEADRLLAEGQLTEAIAKYGEALRAEKRPWVQRMILSRTVRCYAGLGQFEQAATLFLIIADHDPTTQYFDAVPLAWKPHQPSAALQTKAGAWLADEKRPVAVLLGASWLLSTPRRNAAVDALKRLTRDAATDPRVAVLAKAQLWRSQMATASAEDVARWRADIEQMPAPLRGGPYLLLGRALSRLGEGDAAALALMRVPILYGDDRALSADALVAAADELAKLGRRGEALGLYREAASYADTAAAVEAKARMSELGAK